MNEFDRDAMAPQPDAQVNGHAADAPLHDADAPMYVISVAA